MPTAHAGYHTLHTHHTHTTPCCMHTIYLTSPYLPTTTPHTHLPTTTYCHPGWEYMGVYPVVGMPTHLPHTSFHCTWNKEKETCDIIPHPTNTLQLIHFAFLPFCSDGKWRKDVWYRVMIFFGGSLWTYMHWWSISILTIYGLFFWWMCAAPYLPNFTVSGSWEEEGPSVSTHTPHPPHPTHPFACLQPSTAFPYFCLLLFPHLPVFLACWLHFHGLPSSCCSPPPPTTTHLWTVEEEEERREPSCSRLPTPTLQEVVLVVEWMCAICSVLSLPNRQNIPCVQWCHAGSRLISQVAVLCLLMVLLLKLLRDLLEGWTLPAAFALTWFLCVSSWHVCLQHCAMLCVCIHSYN